MTRAALYLRLSESDDASTSIARQEADLRTRASREGWDVISVLTDDGLSGGKRREKADRALEMIRKGEADVLLVWKFDRWSRQGLAAVADLITVLEKRPEARFIADRDGLDSAIGDTWEMQVGMLSVIAKMERKNTRARVRSSVARLRTVEDRYAGGNLPYGYRPIDNPDGPGRVLVVNDGEAAVVRATAARVLAGETAYAVASDLNERKVPTRRGTTWTIQSLRQMLTSPVIVGRVVHRKEVLRDDDGMPREVWPPVLDLDTWHRLRAVLIREKAADAPPPPQRRRRSRLLSGVAACGLCGAFLYVKTNGHGRTAYACTAPSNGRPCPGVSVAADLLDDYVTANFLRDVGTLEVMERRETVPDDQGLADLELAVRDTAAAMASDDADVAALAARLTTLKARRAELRTRPRERVVDLVSTGRTFAETWEAADLAGRQALLSANVAVLSIGKGQRGRRGLDPARVTLVSQPPHVAEASPDALRTSRPVV